MGKDLAAVDPGQIQVEQDQIGTWTFGVRALVPQEPHRFDAVAGNVQFYGAVGIAEGLLRQTDVARAVLDQENLDGSAAGPDTARHVFLSISGNAARQFWWGCSLLWGIPSNPLNGLNIMFPWGQESGARF